MGGGGGGVGVGVEVLTSATLLVEGELLPDEKAPLVDTNAPAIAITKKPKMPMSRIGRGLPVDTVTGPLQRRYRRAGEAGEAWTAPCRSRSPGARQRLRRSEVSSLFDEAATVQES